MAERPRRLQYAQSRQDETGDQRADDANHDISDQPEARAAYDQAGEPASDGTNDDGSNKTPWLQPPFKVEGSILVEKRFRSRLAKGLPAAK